MPLNAQIALSVVAHESSSGDLSSSLRVTPATYAVMLSDGTGANQAQLAWSDTRTLAGSSETLNLSALPDTRDSATATLSFTALKCLYIKNNSTTSIVLAGAAIGPGTFGASRVVPAGAVTVDVIPSSEGRDVSSSPSLTFTGSAGSSYDVMLIGEGSIA